MAFIPPAPPVNLLPVTVLRCAFCGNVWNEDARGKCKSCGAPKPKPERDEKKGKRRDR